MKWRIAALCLTAALAAGCKGDPVKCDQACRNYFTLLYWSNADPIIAAAPPDERDAMRKQKLGEFEAQITRGIDVCSTQCMSANDEKDVDCMLDAKTAPAVKACLAD
jgi:hypothetical protein